MVGPVQNFLRIQKDTPLEYQDTVEVEVEVSLGKNTKTTGDLNYPISYGMKVTTANNTIELNFQKNNKFDLESVPVLGLKNSKLNQRKSQNQEHYAFYQDITKSAVLMFQTDKGSGNSMIGIFQGGNDRYIMQSVDTKNEDIAVSRNKTFEIYKQEKEEITDGIIDPHYSQTFLNKKSTKRRKRATDEHNVELLFVTDSSIFNYWKLKSTKTTDDEKEEDAIESVKQYYSFLLNGMDAVYKNIQTTDYTINIKFSAIIITQTVGDSPWTEAIVDSEGEVNSLISLSNFSTWINTSPGLPSHDHAMLMTKYSLAYGSSNAWGVAYMSTMCKTKSQSIVRDVFAFDRIVTAAHEVAHSLGAEHDGTENDCLSENHNAMGVGRFPKFNITLSTNSWKFSVCSTNYFTEYIDSLDSDGDNCLKTFGPDYNATALNQFNNILPGQFYGVDEQCINIKGSGSALCRGLYEGNYSQICNVMYCLKPEDPRYCNRFTPGDGTPCGDGKWCIRGICTTNELAPKVDNDTCLFGDLQVQVYYDETWNCTEVIKRYPHRCLNNSWLQNSCCEMCESTMNTATSTLGSSTTVQTTLSSTTTTMKSTSETTLSSTTILTTTTTTLMKTTTKELEDNLGSRASSLWKSKYATVFLSVWILFI
ncbi:unnamed protein product [Mytilus edulis]|uniref:Peptidase M12B domain-containing protein n=1 Tax=Mytilus edulis TaxID=6550 RepID=A0A8S3SD74_MYTED|nr:unnamed protein product [Mytilus edulis]